jgi:hypothetical protein
MTGKKARRSESETERERDLGREGEQHSDGRKWSGLILTVALNQQHLRITTTPENFLKVSINNNNGRIKHQSSFGLAFSILRITLSLPHLLTAKSLYCTIQIQKQNKTAKFRYHRYFNAY